MKIYYFSNSTIPSRAANSIHVMRMCAAFAELGHKVTLFAGQGANDPEDVFGHYGVSRTFKLTRLPRPNRPVIKSLVYSKCVAKEVKRSAPPDLIYGRDPYCLWRAAKPPIPMIYEAHAGPGTMRGNLEGALFCRSNFCRLVVISSALRETYIDRFARVRRDGRIVVAHDAACDESDASPELLLPPPGKGGLHVGYIGHLYAGKGGNIVVALAGRLPKHQFHIIGGSESDIQRIKSSSGQLKNLTIHGFVPPGSLAGLRNAMDVLLAPYQANVAGAGGGDIGRWMSPLKIFEYMAAGKAIIASDLPVLREVLSDNVNSLLVEADSVVKWAEALQFFEDAKKREDYGRKARDSFERKHTWKLRAQTVLSGLELPGGTV